MSCTRRYWLERDWFVGPADTIDDDLVLELGDVSGQQVQFGVRVGGVVTMLTEPDLVIIGDTVRAHLPSSLRAVVPLGKVAPYELRSIDMSGRKQTRVLGFIVKRVRLCMPA